MTRLYAEAPHTCFATRNRPAQQLAAASATRSCRRLSVGRAIAQVDRCARCRPRSCGERKCERVNLGGAGEAQQPRHYGERPAAVDEVVDEENWLPGQL